MRQPLYIRSATAISPQQTFRREDFLQPVLSNDTGKLYALEAPYSQYISPVAIRRMSRILKMTISTAMQCLKEAGVTTPDAILTGTGRGSVTDMEQFVKDMIRLDEAAMNPTLFIQSTYNSPNGWIAMQSACTGYNQTYVHRGCSFELALQDAQMMMAESENPLSVLAGCYDEMTEEYYLIRGKRDYWKTESFRSMNLFDHGFTAGTIGGEGSAFFMLSNEAAMSQAVITDLSIIYRATREALLQSVMQLLASWGMHPEDISVVLTGLNGDVLQSSLYEEALGAFPADTCIAGFKHLCGEYDTATGFAVWLADHMIRQQYTLEVTLLRGIPPARIQHILIINHYIHGTASVMLLSHVMHSSTTRMLRPFNKQIVDG